MTKNAENAALPDSAYVQRPLYQQIYDRVVTGIVERLWLPNTALPSEQALARDMGVSQGTVRRVLDQLTTEGVLLRHQGKGTFVVEHTAELSLYRFFKFTRPGGGRAIPTVAKIATTCRLALPAEQAKLEIEADANVIEINRLRTIDDIPAIRERIVLPARLFAGIEQHAPLPHTLYSLYQSVFGIHIVRALEEVSAVAANADDAAIFDTSVGGPVMQVDRVAMSIKNERVEWRLSRVNACILTFSVNLPST
jgi:GntR family transcriptional regulator